MQIVILGIACCVICSLIVSPSVSAAEIPKPGDKAPLVEAMDQNHNLWKLADVLGKKAVLLYFYPKDDTPGCTREACGLRDHMDEFNKFDAQVVGVSFDSAESHRKFIEKYGLNFTLLADTEGKVADAYGVRAPGRNAARRVSFLIGRDGKIAYVTDSPNAEVHIREMRDAVAKLSAR